MFWSAKKFTKKLERIREEPPLQGKRRQKMTSLQENSYNITIYANLLGVSSIPDDAAYRRDFKMRNPRNSDGIPLAFEEQAERVGRIIASAYEERYDQVKAQLAAQGLQFSALIKDDESKLLSVNFAALASAPIVSRITDRDHLIPYGIAALHWLLATEEAEWIFSHLVEATGAYYRSAGLRDQLVSGYADDFNDLRDLLREAFRHYLHRHV